MGGLRGKRDGLNVMVKHAEDGWMEHGGNRAVARPADSPLRVRESFDSLPVCAFPLFMELQ